VAFVVVYDACVLYPAPLRDLLLRIATSGIVRARWSERILDECFRSIRHDRPDLPPAALTRTRSLMIEAVPDCMVTGYELLAAGLDLPDPNDQHVLAAAIRANAQAIITFNLKDFPDHVLGRYDIESKHPDEFIVDSIDIVPGAVAQCLADQVAALRSPQRTTEEVLETLHRCGLIRSVARLRDLLATTG
jgi:predicted nucleic acid-binding protein